MKTKAQLFDAQALLTKVNRGKRTAKYQPKKPLFRQGDPANALLHEAA
jgi:hypothetical protein